MTRPVYSIGEALTLHDKLARCHPSLSRGQVWCRTCGFTRQVDSANALRTSWPKCCGYTMTRVTRIDTARIYMGRWIILAGIACMPSGRCKRELHALLDVWTTQVRQTLAGRRA